MSQHCPTCKYELPCDCPAVSGIVDRITAVLRPMLAEELEPWIGTASLELARTLSAEMAERVAAGLPRFGEIREAYEFYQLDSDKAMAAQIFVQQVGEILEAES